MSPVFNTAWLRTEEKHAVICSWCADAVAAERRARECGLGVTHGICDECRATFDSSTAHVSEHSHGAPAQAAAASTPPAGAAWVDFIPLHEVARICGVDGFEIIAHLRPEHWLLGRHYRGLPGDGGFELLIGALPDLTGQFSVSGRKSAALALMRWLIERSEQRLAAERKAL